MPDSYSDPANLRHDAYRTPDAVLRRQSIYDYRRPPLDLVEFALSLLPSEPGSRFLDLGCGPGRYGEGVRRRWISAAIVAADLSSGMVTTAADASGAAGVAADACALPFRDGVFDVTLAMHMLYHLPDMTRGVREIRRVTAEGGVALVSTNSVDHLRELKSLFAQALVDVRGGPIAVPTTEADRFNLENGGDILADAFDDVRRKAAWGMLAVPNAQVVREYTDSLRPLRRDVVPDDDEWRAVIDRIKTLAAALIEDRGVIEIATRTGVFVCRARQS